jgi:hypothetical protein
MRLAAAVRNTCEFESLGKILHQIRKWIAALLAPKSPLNTTKLVAGFPDPHWGQLFGHSIGGRGVTARVVRTSHSERVETLEL